jgi:hypothetical protein
MGKSEWLLQQMTKQVPQMPQPLSLFQGSLNLQAAREKHLNKNFADGLVIRH